MQGVLSKSFTLESISKFKNIAIGSRFNMSRVESKYIDLEKELISKPKNQVANILMKLITTKTANRFINNHGDYADILVNMKHTSIVIKCDNPWKLAFNFLVNVMTVISVIYSLYQLSFNWHETENVYYELSVFLVFFADFVLNFFTEYVDQKKNSYQNLNIIFVNYLKTWLVFDLAALFPLNLFGYYEVSHFLQLIRIFRIRRVFQTFMIKNVTDYLKATSTSLTAEKQKLYLVIENCYELCIEIFKLLFICYLFACVWVGIIKRVNEGNEADVNFISYYSINDKPAYEQVVICMYFIFTTLTTVGYGDYLAQNNYEMGLCIVIMLLGSAWLALIMSKVTSFVMAFEKIGKTKDKLNELTVFIRCLENIHGPMPSVLKRKILTHFTYFWKKDRLGSLMNTKWNSSKQTLTETSDPILENLPYALKKSIFNYLFQDYFLAFFKFFGLGDDFRYEICVFMQPRFYNDEFIIFIEEKASELLLLKSGKVIVGLYDEEYGFLSCFTMFPGVIIGESGVFLNESSFADLKSEKAEGMALCGAVVLEIMKKKYNEKLREYKEIVMLRSTTIKKLMQENPEYKKRTVRTSIQARLSNVFNSVKSQPNLSITLKDLYLDMKNNQKAYEDLEKTLKEMLNSSLDN